MSDVEVTVDVAAPRQAVWDVLTDVDRLGDWMVVHDGFAAPPPPVEAGAQITQQLSAAGIDAEVEWTVEEADEPASLTWHGRGPAGSEAVVRYRLEVTEGGTRITSHTDMDLPGGPLGAVAEKVAVPRGREEAQRSLERLRDLVEEA